MAIAYIENGNSAVKHMFNMLTYRSQKGIYSGANYSITGLYKRFSFVGSEQSSKPVMAYFELDHSEQISMKFKPIYNDFHRENEFFNAVCQIAGILSLHQCVELHKTNLIY